MRHGGVCLGRHSFGMVAGTLSCIQIRLTYRFSTTLPALRHGIILSFSGFSTIIPPSQATGTGTSRTPRPSGQNVTSRPFLSRKKSNLPLPYRAPIPISKKFNLSGGLSDATSFPFTGHSTTLAVRFTLHNLFIINREGLFHLCILFEDQGMLDSETRPLL